MIVKQLTHLKDYIEKDKLLSKNGLTVKNTETNDILNFTAFPYSQGYILTVNNIDYNVRHKEDLIQTVFDIIVDNNLFTEENNTHLNIY